MRAGNELCWTRLIEALNEGIERELKNAETHIARASAADNLHEDAVRRRFSVCAAAAMRHATSLAAEVISLGGVPQQRTTNKSRRPDGLQLTSDLFRRYRQQRVMAKSLGLYRLEEVLREIIHELRICSRTRSGMFRLVRIG